MAWDSRCGGAAFPQRRGALGVITTQPEGSILDAPTPVDAVPAVAPGRAPERHQVRPPARTRLGPGDGAVAVALAAACLVGVFVNLPVDLPEGVDPARRDVDGAGIGLAMLQVLPLAWRRRAPIPVLCVTSGALLLSFALGYPPSLASAGFLVALYTVASHRERRASIPAGIGSYAVVLSMLILGSEPFEPDAMFAELLIVGAAWGLGDGSRVRRGQVIQLEDRATRLERDREERAARAVAEERRVIARELHDMVAHSVTVIVAQAGAAQRIFDSAPREALGALGAIEQTGREALVEMRRLMGFLRTAADDQGAHSPQPGLRHLDALITQVREAGLSVTLRIEGEPRPLPLGLDLSAFRIVQEALTNVLKHAGPAHVEVVVRYDRDRLELTVNDDGHGLVRDGRTDPGYGQLGMRERAALFGGELRVGPRANGGYQVFAVLPSGTGAP